MHTAARQWLTNELTAHTRHKRMVVTHHAPSRQSVASQYQDDAFTLAYVGRIESVVQLSLFNCNATALHHSGTGAPGG